MSAGWIAFVVLYAIGVLCFYTLAKDFGLMDIVKSDEELRRAIEAHGESVLVFMAVLWAPLTLIVVTSAIVTKEKP